MCTNKPNPKDKPFSQEEAQRFLDGLEAVESKLAEVAGDLDILTTEELTSELEDIRAEANHATTRTYTMDEVMQIAALYSDAKGTA